MTLCADATSSAARAGIARPIKNATSRTKVRMKAALLVAGLQGLQRGFGFGPCPVNRVAGNGDVWRVGLRKPVNDTAGVRQGIQDNVKCGLRFSGLSEAGTA